MVTILKSCTNLLTALGETFVDHTRHGVKVIFAFHYNNFILLFHILGKLLRFGDLCS